MREDWIDRTKILACFLVVLGHVMQGMVSAGIISEGIIFNIFINALYCFHVQLFFICSGYLYQNYCNTDSIGRWITNLKKKSWDLGVPYFLFSTMSIVFKNADKNGKEMFRVWLDTTFLNPTAPYWYLYALFFMFIVYRTFREKRAVIYTATLAIVMKIVFLTTEPIHHMPYFIRSLFCYSIWFVAGMFLAFLGDKIRIEKRKTTNICKILMGGTACYIMLYLLLQQNDYVDFVYGVLMCCCIIACFVCSKSKREVYPMVKYTMPVYLMHTLFSATTRSVLIRIGVQNMYLHLFIGITAGLVGPIIIYHVLRIIKVDTYIFCPSRRRSRK